MSRTHGTKESWLASLRAEGAAFLTAVSEPGVLGVTVPSCPEWGVADLIRHLGAVYRRTRRNADSGSVDQHWGPVIVPDDAPAALDTAVIAWFSEEFALLDAFLDALDPDLPTWNWAPQTKTAAFWHRRMAHETALHRWDAQLATGLPEPMDGRVALDTVAEVLDTFLPAGRRRTPAPDVAGLAHLVAADHNIDWYLRLRGAGVSLLDTDTLLDDDTHAARASATGTASDLALALWGRIAFDVLDTAGDPALLDAIITR